MEFSPNSWIVWLCAGGIICLVLAQSVFFLIRSLKRAKAIGMDKRVIKKTISASAVFTIAPAFAILIGVVTLIPALGIPLPWVRLSVIGAITYEVPAASAALQDLGRTFETPYGTLTAGQFIIIIIIMTLGVMAGPILAPILVEPYKKGMVKLQQKDKKWGEIFSSALFMGMIATFLGMIFKDIRNPEMSPGEGWIPVLVMAVSAIIMALCGILLKKLKWKWLNDYALPISMILSMAAAIPLTNWIVG